MTITISVIHSAHTDIGYTHPQEQIARMYIDHYDRVLDLCKRTERKPESERFRWICETFWQVENYLSNRPDRLDEFLHFVRAGQIEVTASYLHFVDMIDTDAYRRSIKIAVNFCQKHDIPLKTAMHCDINGWPWSVADILAEYNIPYFCSQIHIDNATDPLGQRGSVHYHWVVESEYIRSDASIRVPQAFWWVGPNNGRVLHWLNEHYLLGNVLGISSPQPFGADKTRYFYETDHLSSDDLYEIASRELPRYVERVRNAGYKYDNMLLSTGGYYTDNARPDDRWLDVIAKWNENHDEIRIRTSTLSEWFDILANQNTDDLPSYQVAWPDHWAHGLGSSTAHIAQARRTQRRRSDIEALVNIANSDTASEFLNLAFQQEILSLEHTFGAWSTSGRPEDTLNHFQQIAKDLTYHRAELYLDEAAGVALRSAANITAHKEKPTLVIPGRNHKQALINFDARDQKVDPEHHVLADAANNSYAIQYDDVRTGRFVSVLPTDSHNQATYYLTEKPVDTSIHTGDSPDTQLSNENWSLEIDPATGGLVNLTEANQGRNWVDTTASYQFGQIIHEQVVHPLKYHAVGNLKRLIELGSATEESRDLFEKGPVFEHSQAKFNPQIHKNLGAVYDSLMLQGQSEQLGRLAYTWRIYHQLPVVELVIDWHKIWNDLPEAVYIAFPFATKAARLEFETGGEFFEPGSHKEKGQLPGTSSRYYTIHRAAKISDDEQKLLWLPVDAPLVMTNDINYSYWEIDPWKWNGLLASMPVNHYWHTNFPTSQRGYIRLRYRLINPDLFKDDETAIQSVLPVDAYGWF
ncbi:MAG: hypothetical protein KC708_11450 [Anaerolineae bacterium]|nr:hypothetical protein [Anaerolineae bacterium]